jgi:protein-S-isoprenylcysteine O-methyltransferase Ste14
VHPDQVARVVVPALVAATLLLTGVFPAVRQRLRTGSFGLALLSRRDPAERAIGLCLGIAFVGAIVWAALVATCERAPFAIAAPPWLAWAGVALGVVGIAVIALAQAQMGASWRIGIDAAPTALVTSGLFALSRNPIYSGLLALAGSIAALTPASPTIIGLAASCILVSIQARLEERHLLAQHGQAYRDYASRVGRFVPWLGRLSRNGAGGA